MIFFLFQLLAKACESSCNGHAAVSEALSTLRLRFGEPVRFRFLVGMLSSASGQSDLLINGLKFVNSFLESSGSIQKRLYIQAELEQAGFDLNTIKKVILIDYYLILIIIFILIRTSHQIRRRTNCYMKK